MSPQSTAKLAVGEFISEHRYFVLCGAILALMASHLSKHTWPVGVDIWEHAAVVRELADRPFRPEHPLFTVDRPHQFFSPYLYAIALVVRLTRFDLTTAFAIFGLFNLILFFVSLRILTKRLIPHPHADFYALLFVLLLWGPRAWETSGFLHFGVLAVVLSYPATFVKGLILLAIVSHINYVETDNPRWLLPTLFISAVTILTHPIDQVFLAIGLLTVTLTVGERRRRRQLATTVLVLAAGFICTLAWPFMSITHILFAAEAAPYRQAFRESDADLYEQVFVRFGFAMLVLPVIGKRTWHWQRDPLVSMFMGVAAVYAFGWALGDPVLGRLAAWLQVVAAMILAHERTAISHALSSLGGRGGARKLRRVQAMTMAILLVGMISLRHGFRVLPQNILERLPTERTKGTENEVANLEFMKRNSRDHLVVLANLTTSLEIPAFGSKVVDADRPQAFVDTRDRRRDLERFFDRASSHQVRRDIIEKYGVSLLVLDVADLVADPQRASPLLELGTIVDRNERFVFVSLKPSGVTS